MPNPLKQSHGAYAAGSEGVENVPKARESEVFESAESKWACIRWPCCLVPSGPYLEEVDKTCKAQSSKFVPSLPARRRLSWSINQVDKALS